MHTVNTTLPTIYTDIWMEGQCSIFLPDYNVSTQNETLNWYTYTIQILWRIHISAIHTYETMYLTVFVFFIKVSLFHARQESEWVSESSFRESCTRVKLCGLGMLRYASVSNVNPRVFQCCASMKSFTE